MKRVLITHANCMDGIGCAVAVRQFEIANSLEKCEIIFMNYNSSMDKIYDLHPSMEILMADFSLGRNAMIGLHNKHNGNVKVLDHHASAEKELEGLDFCVFDMTKSGAVLTWEFLFRYKAVPELLNYIQDRDLWNWTLPDSAEVSASLKLMDKFDIDSFMPYLDDVSPLIAEGKSLLKYEQAHIDKIVRRKDKLPRINLEGYNSIICINTTTLISELGNALVNDEPFVAMFFIKDNEAIFSLRADGEVDVSLIAKSYGGGGHPNAAGFSIDLNNLYFMLNS